jgi:hypothetical protein
MYFYPPHYYAPGTWLRVRSPGWVDHHGIVVGYGPDGALSVVHALKRQGVVRTLPAQFSGNLPLEVVRYPRSHQEGQSIASRAYSQLGAPYDLFSANCEQFASWAVTGVPHSEQLAIGVVSLIAAGLTIAAIRSEQ